jgi:hypothetical protein
MEETTNSNRETNKKILKVVGAVIAGIIVLGVIGGVSGESNNSTPTTSAVSDTTISTGVLWSSWASGFSPVWQKFYADWNKTLADLGNADEYAARQDFAQLGQDAAEISSWSTSPDESVNTYIRTLANDINSVSFEGIQSLSNIDNGGEITDGFLSSCNAVKADIADLTDAITYGNSTY